MSFELPEYSSEKMDEIGYEMYLDVYDDIDNAWREKDIYSFVKWYDLIQNNNEKYGMKRVPGKNPFDVVINYVQNKYSSFTTSNQTYAKYIEDNRDKIVESVKGYTNTLESNEYIYKVSADALMKLYLLFGWILEGIDLSNDNWLDCNEISDLCV